MKHSVDSGIQVIFCLSYCFGHVELLYNVAWWAPFRLCSEWGRPFRIHRWEHWYKHALNYYSALESLNEDDRSVSFPHLAVASDADVDCTFLTACELVSSHSAKEVSSVCWLFLNLNYLVTVGMSHFWSCSQHLNEWAPCDLLNSFQLKRFKILSSEPFLPF